MPRHSGCVACQLLCVCRDSVSYNVNIYEKDPAEQKKYLDKLVKYEVLALDDFGSSMYNENIKRFLFELIDR